MQRRRAKTGTCCKCGIWRASLHRDHIVPTWAGGPDVFDNWQYLCANCHEDKTFEERQSDAYRKFISDMTKARMLSQDARQRISDGVRRANLGRVWTEEMRQRCSLATKGRKRSPADRAKVSAGLKGKPKSAAHCAALSAAQRRRFAVRTAI